MHTGQRGRLRINRSKTRLGEIADSRYYSRPSLAHSFSNLLLRTGFRPSGRFWEMLPNLCIPCARNGGCCIECDSANIGDLHLRCDGSGACRLQIHAPCSAAASVAEIESRPQRHTSIRLGLPVDKILASASVEPARHRGTSEARRKPKPTSRCR